MADFRSGSLKLVNLFPDGSGTNTFALNATANKAARIFQAETTDAITDVFLSFSARAGTSPTWTVGFQGVDSSGLPDGTYKGGGTPASATFTVTATGAKVVTLANAYTPARGELLALVVEHSSGTIDGSNNATIRQGLSSALRQSFPYAATSTGTWSKATAVQACFFGYKTASRWFGAPAESLSARTESAAAGRRVALKFRLPSGMGSSFKISALEITSRPVVFATTDFKLALWDAASTVLQDKTLNTAQLLSTSVLTNKSMTFDESMLATLAFNTDYYLGFESVDATQPTMDVLTFDHADRRNAMSLGGNVLVSSYDGSVWTDQLELPLYAALVLEDWTAASEGGGGRRPRARYLGV